MFHLKALCALPNYNIKNNYHNKVKHMKAYSVLGAVSQSSAHHQKLNLVIIPILKMV